MFPLVIDQDINSQVIDFGSVVLSYVIEVWVQFLFCPDFDSLATCVSFMLFLQIEISIFCVNFLWNKQPPVCSMTIHKALNLKKVQFGEFALFASKAKINIFEIF